MAKSIRKKIINKKELILFLIHLIIYLCSIMFLSFLTYPLKDIFTVEKYAQWLEIVSNFLCYYTVYNILTITIKLKSIFINKYKKSKNHLSHFREIKIEILAIVLYSFFSILFHLESKNLQPSLAIPTLSIIYILLLFITYLFCYYILWWKSWYFDQLLYK
ncbi:Uncharacterised protein [Suttonella ornithocola]|uniref:Uncharacterized protein n=1 Tax=Suttonella ornithocola TaxID=279832 RepID=A0A380MY49_9GAMM|nr:Uncharacterised protein [Suttonella ornithocola]